MPRFFTALRASRASWFALGLLSTGAIWAGRGAITRPHPLVAEGAAPAAVAGLQGLPTGPWGHLESTQVLLEPPDEYLPTGFRPAEAIRWVFRGYTSARLDELWQRAGLPPAQRAALNDPARIENSGEAIAVHPDLQVVLNLSTTARAIIYAALAEFPENFLQCDPFRLCADSPREWFADSGVSPAIREMTQRMLYARGSAIMFSDAEFVLPRIESAAARGRYVKTLFRKSTLLVSLVVGHGADVESLGRYWCGGSDRKDVLPLLESLARRPGGGAVDIVHLLPALPRSLLYTYPPAAARPGETDRDCHWSSLNFWNERPDERYLQCDRVKQALAEDYRPVAGPPALGDVIVLVTADGTAIHSCVYVAADVVFTKNGPSIFVPWMLSRLEGVMAFYSNFGPLEVRRFRRKV